MTTAPAASPNDNSRLATALSTAMEETAYTTLPGGPTTAAASTTTMTQHAAAAATENGAPTHLIMDDEDLEEGDLPTPFQLWKHIYANILFGNPLLRDLVYWDMALHLACWLCFTGMLWAFFLGYLPFNLAFKIYFFGLMGIFVSRRGVYYMHGGVVGQRVTN